MSSELKKCSRCGKEKPLTEFYRNKTSKSGYDNYCKDRSNQIRKINYHKLLNKKELSGLHAFSPRQLMEELKTRGYTGKLFYTEIHEIDLSNI